MQEKWISFLIGILMWVTITLAYSYIFNTNTSPQMWPGWFWWWNMQMTDERLNQMAERLWMTKEDLQKEIDAWKDIRTLMQEKGITQWNWNFNGREERWNQNSN